jgi:CheY-like chemotaxis protein
MNSSAQIINTKQTVMVVDDDKLAQFFLKNMIEALGYEVLIAENGSEAVRSFRNNIHTITMDYNMPEMNGVEATEAIREKERKQETLSPVFIIGITAHDDKQTIEACLAAGMNKVVTKPLSPELLEECLRL